MPEVAMTFEDSLTQLVSKFGSLGKLLDNIPSAIVIYELDGDGTLAWPPLYVSEKACALLGLSREKYLEALGNPETAGELCFLPPNSLKQLEELPEDSHFTIFTRRIKTPGGSVVRVRSKVTLHTSGDGRICLVTVEDDSINAKLSLRQRVITESYNLIIESSDVIAFRYDPQNDYLCYSRPIDGKRSDVERPNFVAELDKLPGVPAESANIIREEFKKLKTPPCTGKVELYLGLNGEKMRWYEMRYTAISEDETTPIEDGDNIFQIVGRLLDIQNIKDRDTALDASAAHEVLLIRSLMPDSMLMLEFDITTGVRIKSEYDVLPQGFPSNLTVSECAALLIDRLHPDEKHIVANFCDQLYSIPIGHKCTDSCRINITGENDVAPNYVWAELSAICLSDSKTGHRAVFVYASRPEQKSSGRKITESAESDPLTALLNRTAFERRVAESLTFSGDGQPESEMSAIVLVEWTSLEAFNRKYGYVTGDNALMGIADTLRAFQRNGEFAARIRAAEFAFYISSAASVSVLRERIRILFTALTTVPASDDQDDDSKVKDAPEAEPRQLYIGASIAPVNGMSFSELFSKADRALCHAKSQGDVNFQLYKDGMELPTETESSYESDSSEESKHVFVRALGYFDVFVDGRAVMFKLAKAKELLAILIDRRGGFVTASEAITCLWEDEPANKLTMSRYRKVAMRLKNQLEEYGIGDIIEVSGGARRIIPERINCDYYNYLSGQPEYSRLFKGVYLTNYSWAEDTLASLENGEAEM